MHASNLVKELYGKDPNAEIVGWGGDKMSEAGVHILKHYRELAFMGFVEVIKNIITILKNFRVCKQQISSFSPDVLVLVDYPGFNLRMAKWAHQRKIKVVYYISPQVWAWKENRVKNIKKYVDKMLCILPFEKEYYKKWNYDVEYVGHPLLDEINTFKEKHTELVATKTIALLPGSRKQEIEKILPKFITISSHFKEYQFIIAKAPSISEDFYKPFYVTTSNISLSTTSTYEVLVQSTMALVASGTATLETCLLGVPQIACYNANAFSIFLARKLIKLQYISLVNIIANKKVIEELIHKDLEPKHLVEKIKSILFDNTKREAIKNEYLHIQNKLAKGNASKSAASIIYNFSKEKAAKEKGD